MSLNPGLLVSVHCYAGDRGQVEAILPLYEHHQAPLIIVSPEDSQVHGIKTHHTRCAGKVGYIGQHTWDREHAQLELLLSYGHEFTHFLLNDSDSLVLTPKLPRYLYEDDNVVFGCKVRDFRYGDPRFPNYHPEDEKAALQPPYFASRKALQKIVDKTRGIKACPICPFIDFWWIRAARLTGVRTAGFRNFVSCNSVTPHERSAMANAIRGGATFIHSVKSRAALDNCLVARAQYLSRHPSERS